MDPQLEVDYEYDLFDSRSTRLNCLSTFEEIVEPTYFPNRFPGTYYLGTVPKK